MKKINPEDPVETIEQLRAVLDCIRFAPSCVDMGWQWDILTAEAYDQDKSHGPIFEGWLISTTFQRPDTDTGVIGRGKARPMWIQKGSSFDAVIKTAWVAAKLVVDHELMEAFLVQLIEGVQRRLFDPHAKVTQDVMADRHFCEVPREAVCSYPLVVIGAACNHCKKADEDWSRFYNETTNCFADVTCEGCRKWLRDNRFGPGGFPDPSEWNNNRGEQHPT